MIWDKDAVATLKWCATYGKTFSEAAAEIGKGCTRNMVAGKAKRLGVTFAADLKGKLTRAGQASATRMWADPTYRAKQQAERKSRRAKYAAQREHHV